MNLIKKCLNRVFVEGLSGMALGLFATLIIGTIIQQIGTLAGGSIGTLIYAVGKMAAGLTCAGIGVGVAYKFQESPMVVLSAATSGMIGGYASKVLAGTLLVDGNLALQGPGEPLGAFIAAYVGIEIGHLVAGKTRLDIILVPLLSIGTGSAVGVLVGPSISSFMTWLGGLINWGTEQQPFLMGIVVSVLMGMILTLPISSAALGVILNLSGLAAGAATVGCCCNMIGFAVASFRENGVGGLIAQGVGTSMLQVPNIVKKPLIWLPVILSSAVLGPVSTMLFHMTNNATGSGMGSAGFVGQIMTWQVMAQTEHPVVVLLKIVVIQFMLPAVLTVVFTQFMSTEIELERIIYQKEFDGKFVGCQIMDGDIDVFLGIAGEDADLLCVASTFSQEDMNKFDADAYDAICELINIINGAYATKLSYEEIEVSLHPPVFYQDTQIKADNGMYVVTFNMKGHRFNLLMVADDKVTWA